MKETVRLNGEKWEVRADYRKIMAVIRVLTDPTLEMYQQARAMAALKIFYVGFDRLTDYTAAYETMREFMDRSGKQEGPRLIDFSKDWNDIVAAVNKSAGQPIRNMEFLHIDDFMGYLQERDPECTLSHKINIRHALATGKFGKLPKELKEFYYKNKDEIDLEPAAREPVRQPNEEEQAKILEEFYTMGR